MSLVEDLLAMIDVYGKSQNAEYSGDNQFETDTLLSQLEQELCLKKQIENLLISTSISDLYVYLILHSLFKACFEFAKEQPFNVASKISKHYKNLAADELLKLEEETKSRKSMKEYDRQTKSFEALKKQRRRRKGSVTHNKDGTT